MTAKAVASFAPNGEDRQFWVFPGDQEVYDDSKCLRRLNHHVKSTNIRSAQDYECQSRQIWPQVLVANNGQEEGAER